MTFISVFYHVKFSVNEKNFPVLGDHCLCFTVQLFLTSASAFHTLPWIIKLLYLFAPVFNVFSLCHLIKKACYAWPCFSIPSPSCSIFGTKKEQRGANALEWKYTMDHWSKRLKGCFGPDPCSHLVSMWTVLPPPQRLVIAGQVIRPCPFHSKLTTWEEYVTNKYTIKYVWMFKKALVFFASSCHFALLSFLISGLHW